MIVKTFDKTPVFNFELLLKHYFVTAHAVGLFLQILEFQKKTVHFEGQSKTKSQKNRNIFTVRFHILKQD